MNDFEENGYGFFIELDSHVSDTTKEREKYFKKLYWKLKKMSTIIEEMEEDEYDYYHNINADYENPLKNNIRKIDSIIHYSTATICTFSLVYIVFCLL
jgi:hypothetical protein